MLQRREVDDDQWTVKVNFAARLRLTANRSSIPVSQSSPTNAKNRRELFVRVGCVGRIRVVKERSVVCSHELPCCWDFLGQQTFDCLASEHSVLALATVAAGRVGSAVAAPASGAARILSAVAATCGILRLHWRIVRWLRGFWHLGVLRLHRRVIRCVLWVLRIVVAGRVVIARVAWVVVRVLRIVVGRVVSTIRHIVAKEPAIVSAVGAGVSWVLLWVLRVVGLAGRTCPRRALGRGNIHSAIAGVTAWTVADLTLGCLVLLAAGDKTMVSIWIEWRIDRGAGGVGRGLAALAD